MSLFGGGNNAMDQKPTYTGLQLQTSTAGLPIPLAWGTAPVSPNLIDYDDFVATPHTSQDSSGGKGGGSGSSGSTSYTYSAMAILALCEGAIDSIGSVWADKTGTTLAALGMFLAKGTDGQGVWPYLTSKHPDKGLSYRGTAYVANGAYDLGSSANLPNHVFEIGKTTGFQAVSGSLDANPALITQDFLTNVHYGAMFPATSLADISDYRNYCDATGLHFSPVIDSVEQANSILDRWAQITNVAPVWSGGQLKLIPRGDTEVTGNGITWNPNLTPEYDLDYDDFLVDGEEDPVTVTRADIADAYNSVSLNISDRALQYDNNTVQATDQSAIEQYGLRDNSGIQATEIRDATVAAFVAQLILQRGLYVRTTYQFKLGWKYSRLEPMDLVTLTDPNLGLDHLVVRITEMEEDDQGRWTVTAEEFPPGIAHATAYPKQGFDAYRQDFLIPPGSVTGNVIFEPHGGLTNGHPEVWVAACGGAHWGGCNVWLSADNVTFKKVGTITAPARMGTLSNTLAAGSDPDTAHTLSVDLSVSGGKLTTGTTADADNGRTLCFVDGEVLTYQTASLTGANQYGLTYLRRGLYATAIGSHAAGQPFCWLGDSSHIDRAIFRYGLPAEYVGVTIYLKFTSFNQFRAAEESLAGVTAYPYAPSGKGSFVAPPANVSISVGADQNSGDGSVIPFMVISWDASPDALIDMYDVQYRLHAGPGAWQSLRVSSDVNSVKISPIPVSTAYDAQVRAVRTDGGPFFSAWAQDLNISTTGKTAPPLAPTSLNVIGGYRQITLSWTASAEKDIAWYEIWEGPDATFAHAAKIGQVNSDHYLRPGLNLTDTRYYWVRAQDTSGNFSAFLGPGHATTNAVDAADLTGKIIGSQIDNATIEGANLADDIIDYSKMASGYGIAASVGSLPGPVSPLRYAGSLVLLTTNAKLYRWDSVGNAWTAATDGGDITANSIVASSLVAGIITSTYLGAYAVTASKAYFGDTTNLVTDPIFLDQAAWDIADSVGTVASFVTGTTQTTALATGTAIRVNTSNIPANTGGNFGVSTALRGVSPNRTHMPVHQKTAYRASCQALAFSGAVNKNANLIITWYDNTMTAISSSNADGPQTGGTYASTDVDADGNAFIGGNGGTILNTATSPVGAAYARLFFAVPGGGTGAPAGAGNGWWATAMRLERQTVGTLIQDGVITTDHIVAGGIDAIAITAGTITGDRMTATFLDSNRYTTVHTSGQPYIEINGKSQTVGSHQNGPWFLANDGTRNRVVIGQLQDAWGLWVYDAAGNAIFSESALGTSVVGTTNIAGGAVTLPNTSAVSTATGNGAWQTIASFTINSLFGCPVLLWGNVLTGFPSGAQVTGRRIVRVGGGGATIATNDGPGSSAIFNTGPSISGFDVYPGGSVAYTYRLDWYGASSGASSPTVNGGSFISLGAFR